jgi:hypothetical protein
MAIMFGFVIVTLVLGAIQALWVFPHPARVVVASAVLAGAAWPAARASMRMLERRTRAHLDAFSTGPARMFASAGDEAS